MNYYGLDWLIIILTFIITLGAQAYINSTYRRMKNVKSKCGMAGADVARKILDSNGLENVKVVETGGVLSDHYDPRAKVVRLSPDVYAKSSIASISVAAHECGHAIQDKNNYAFLRIRNSIIPLVNFASSAGYVAIVVGLFTSALGLLWLGILLEIVILAFQVITLPVEFNASSRALKQLEELKILDVNEKSKGRKMLKAAALTYVAAVATAVLEIFRLIMIANARNDD
ncbi:MAG: zinc metallopeptidase [Bacilli bacterium]|nr:zinc metallopeptidase [Bacilli bacterium]